MQYKFCWLVVMTVIVINIMRHKVLSDRILTGCPGSTDGRRYCFYGPYLALSRCFVKMIHHMRIKSIDYRYFYTCIIVKESSLQLLVDDCILLNYILV